LIIHIFSLIDYLIFDFCFILPQKSKRGGGIANRCAYQAVKLYWTVAPL